jgi:hypothetical protein
VVLGLLLRLFVRVLWAVVYVGMLGGFLQRSLKSLLGVLHRLGVRVRRWVAVHGEACEQGVCVRATLQRRVYPSSTRLRTGLGVVVGAGLLVGLRVVARLDVRVDCRWELLAGVVGHFTPSSPGPSWPSS